LITQDQLISKLGKEGYKKFVIEKSNSGTDRMIDIRRKTGRGTNIKSRMCQHGVWVIDNYERKRCNLCLPKDRNISNFNPFVSIATGNYYETKSEMIKDYKAHGMTWIGSDKL